MVNTEFRILRQLEKSEPCELQRIWKGCNNRFSLCVVGAVGYLFASCHAAHVPICIIMRGTLRTCIRCTLCTAVYLKPLHSACCCVPAAAASCVLLCTCSRCTQRAVVYLQPLHPACCCVPAAAAPCVLLRTCSRCTMRAAAYLQLLHPACCCVSAAEEQPAYCCVPAAAALCALLRTCSCCTLRCVCCCLKVLTRRALDSTSSLSKSGLPLCEHTHNIYYLLPIWTFSICCIKRKIFLTF